MPPDMFEPQKRSEIMSHIRSKDTKGEMIVRRYLYGAGFRYRLHDRRLPGCPDIVLCKYKTVVFIHGCFWHAHKGCRYCRTPKTNTDYWSAKLKRNIERDNQAKQALLEMGWNVEVVWECELKKSADDRLECLVNSIMCNVSQ